MDTFNPTFTEEELQTETWKPIQDFEDYYEVSSLGRIRALRAWSGLPANRLVTQRLPDFPRYLIVTITRPGKRKTYRVHKLVATTFIGPCPNGKEVNHINGVKTNCRASNLEYLTPLENREHAKRLGLLPTGSRHGSQTHPERVPRGDRNGARKHPERIFRGEQCHNARFTETDVREVRRLFAAGATLSDLATRFGSDPRSIHRIIRREAWKHVL